MMSRSRPDFRLPTPPETADVFRTDRSLRLHHGDELPRLEIAYETYGELNDPGDNAVLICHALSGDSHVARHGPSDVAGWWDNTVGPGKAIDTDRYFVVCSNTLGGCRGTTGPGSINPRTGWPYASSFPLITIEDMVDAQTRLADRLGIERWWAVVGGSMGGHQAMCWAIRHPHRVANCVCLATGHRMTSQALAFDIVARNAIRSDPNFHDGRYYDQPDRPGHGLAIARMLGHLTYLSPRGMEAKFGPDRLQPRDIATEYEKFFSVGSYLAHQGDRFVDRFDANTYIALSMAMDQFDLGESHDALAASLETSRCRWLIVSFTSDWLFPPWQARQMVRALTHLNRSVSYVDLASDGGHDAFLLDRDVVRQGRLIHAFLDRPATPTRTEPQPGFTRHRLDFDLISQFIEPHASVLDLGCGMGGLLNHLRERDRDHATGPRVGVELEELRAIQTVEQGHPLIQHDLNEGLAPFVKQQFDVVILSQTLESIVHTTHIVEEVLRVGKRVIVSFPNFGYHKIRDALAKDGRSPGTQRGLLHHQWYDTPNRRFLTVLDWQEYCAQRGIQMLHERYLDTEQDREIDPASEDANAAADLAVFVIAAGGG